MDKFVWDCGDNSCLFALNKTGMRTNGGCRCLRKPYAAKEIKRLLEADSLLASFVEYFGAIERGDYDDNRRPKPLRTIEHTWVSVGREILGWKNNE